MPLPTHYQTHNSLAGDRGDPRFVRQDTPIRGLRTIIDDQFDSERVSPQSPGEDTASALADANALMHDLFPARAGRLMSPPPAFVQRAASPNPTPGKTLWRASSSAHMQSRRAVDGLSSSGIQGWEWWGDGRAHRSKNGARGATPSRQRSPSPLLVSTVAYSGATLASTPPLGSFRNHGGIVCTPATSNRHSRAHSSASRGLGSGVNFSNYNAGDAGAEALARSLSAVVVGTSTVDASLCESQNPRHTEMVPHTPMRFPQSDRLGHSASLPSLGTQARDQYPVLETPPRGVPSARTSRNRTPQADDMLTNFRPSAPTPAAQYRSRELRASSPLPHLGLSSVSKQTMSHQAAHDVDGTPSRSQHRGLVHPPALPNMANSTTLVPAAAGRGAAEVSEPGSSKAADGGIALEAARAGSAQTDLSRVGISPNLDLKPSRLSRGVHFAGDDSTPQQAVHVRQQLPSTRSTSASKAVKSMHSAIPTPRLGDIRTQYPWAPTPRKDGARTISSLHVSKKSDHSSISKDMYRDVQAIAMSGNGMGYRYVGVREDL